MPTQRKRIGFLPRSEVQNLIDKICNHNRLSQSKVTGLLVEEALCSRGVLKTTNKELSFDFITNTSELQLSSSSILIASGGLCAGFLRKKLATAFTILSYTSLSEVILEDARSAAAWIASAKSSGTHWTRFSTRGTSANANHRAPTGS